MQCEAINGYNLNESIFERLIRQYESRKEANPDEPATYVALEQQHRMRPDIAAVVKGLMYKDLRNAPHTCNKLGLRGCSDSVLFLDHSVAEGRDAGAGNASTDSASKVNPGEADIVMAVLKYSLQQGYTAADVVLLTPYLGQLPWLRGLLRRENFATLIGGADQQQLLDAGLDDVDAVAVRVYILFAYRGDGQLSKATRPSWSVPVYLLHGLLRCVCCHWVFERLTNSESNLSLQFRRRNAQRWRRSKCACPPSTTFRAKSRAWSSCRSYARTRTTRSASSSRLSASTSRSRVRERGSCSSAMPSACARGRATRMAGAEPGTSSCSSSQCATAFPRSARSTGRIRCCAARRALLRLRRTVGPTGCMRPCDARLRCGHGCTRWCHSDVVRHAECTVLVDARCERLTTPPAVVRLPARASTAWLRCWPDRCTLRTHLLFVTTLHTLTWHV